MQPDEPLATQRVELLGRIVGAAMDLEATIADLACSGASTAEAGNQLQALSRLQRQIGRADRASLSALRTDIAAAVTTAQAVVQQGRASADAARQSDAADTAHAAASSRVQVDEVMRGMKDFDPYLQFASAEDEAAYRQREAERQRYIEDQRRQGTPEGDLNAAGAAVGQMADAAAHGAADSPAFNKRWDALIDSTAKLRAQLVRDGKDVSEIDARLRDDVRRIMKSKGLSDAEVDARLAVHRDNPLDAMKDFVAEQKGTMSAQDLSSIGQSVRESGAMAAQTAIGGTITSLPTAAPTVQIGSLADAASTLLAAGVQPSATIVETTPSHGVMAQVAMPQPSRTV